MRLSPNKLNQKTPRVAKPQGEKLLGGIMPISFFVPEDGSGPRFAGLSDYRAAFLQPRLFAAEGSLAHVPQFFGFRFRIGGAAVQLLLFGMLRGSGRPDPFVDLPHFHPPFGVERKKFRSIIVWPFPRGLSRRTVSFYAAVSHQKKNFSKNRATPSLSLSAVTS